eukprot:14152807-Alexandrium_andersonii.AAC.1
MMPTGEWRCPTSPGSLRTGSARCGRSQETWAMPLAGCGVRRLMRAVRVYRRMGGDVQGHERAAFAHR